VAGKVLVNLATGMEDAERVTVAFLVATAALDQGKSVVVWATKDAVRLALPGEARGEATERPARLSRTGFRGDLWTRMLSWGEEILAVMSRPRKYPEELLERGVPFEGALGP
jgi:predicted peroxiredoxin